ncbi:basigin [Lepeophtheirus salmonis]|uniref:basigin n=1 Tax=Lepeophtheirus salmonis TaxID=72036 RepID=UPI001AE39D75|nr:basigin-like [Lepeophtheirus salmonis]
MTPKLALFLLLIAPLTTLATPKNESMTDIPTGNPVIENKSDELGKVYFGSKLYLNCPVVEREEEEGDGEEEEEEEKDLEEADEKEEETEELKKRNKALKGLLWYKGETVIEAFKNESEDVSLRKKWLYFNSESTENLMGTFVCKYYDEVVGTFHSIIALSVQKLDTSYTVTEGEDLKLHCKVGKPYPTDFSLSWVYKKNLEDIAVPIESLVNASSSEEPHLKILSKDGVPNAVLKIEDAVYEDRAYYYCIVDSKDEKVRVGTLVRVKDKYAALWPFLGIVAEVIVLCLVILICDKRAAKKEDVDDDDVGNSGGAGNAGGDGSGLRQRK